MVYKKRIPENKKQKTKYSKKGFAKKRVLFYFADDFLKQIDIIDKKETDYEKFIADK